MLEKVKVKFIMLSLPNKKVTPFPKKKLVRSEKVKPSEEVEKVTTNLDGMKEAVVRIRRKDLDNFRGQSIGSIGWLVLIVNFLKKIFYT